MFDSALIRLVGGQLCWYPPGVEEGPRALDSEDERARLQAYATQGRGKLLFAVPGTDVSLTRVEYAPSEKKHLARALPFTLEEQLVSEVENLHFAMEMLDKQSIGVAICDRAAMADWQDQLSACPSVTAWVAEPQLLPWQAGEWTVVIEAGYAIARTGQCEGFSIELELLEQMLMAAMTEIDLPQAVIIYGQDQAADCTRVPEALRELVQWRHGDLCAAMLLRQEDAIAVNLLQGDYAQRLPLQRWWLEWRTVAAVFAAAFLLQLIAGYSSYLSLERENLALRQEIQNSYRQAFPKGALVDAEKQVRRQLDALRGTAQSSGFISLMSRVGEIIASKPGAAIASINYNEKGGEMRINITAADFAAVEAIRTAMTEGGLEAVMENSNVQGDQVRARLRVGTRS